MSEWPKALPGGHYTITSEDNNSLCAAVGATPDRSGNAHPIFYYIAGQCGMGLSVAEMLSLCDFDVANGPMLTRSEVHFDRDLRVGENFEVSGEILSLVRKPSRTFGAVDQLSFRLDLIDATGNRALSAIHHWILPRSEATR